MCDAILFDAIEHDLSLEEIMRVAHGYRTVDTIRLVAPHLAAAEEAARFDAREAFDAEGVVGIEGAGHLLRALAAQRWAVVTSGTRDLAVTRMRHTDLPIPPVLVTADDVALGKPDPEAYLLAAARLNVMPETSVVVEDAPAGIRAAHLAGMRVVALATTHRLDRLGEADAQAMHLTDIHISPIEVESGGRLSVRVTRV